MEEENTEKLPIILIPGMGASQLEARYLSKTHSDEFLDTSWKIFYLNFMNMANLDYVVKKLRMKSNDCCTDVVNYDSNLLIRPYNFGSVDGVKYTDKMLQKFTYVFKFMVDFFVNSLGYEKNVNIFGAPYDFRCVSTKYDMKRFFTNLDELIQLSYSIHRKPCILISHSMGCMLISEYLHQKSPGWKNHYVDSWISISGAFGGSVKALKTLISGGLGDYTSFKMNNDIIMETVRTFPGLYYLLPNCDAFTKQDVVLESCNATYNCDQYDALFRDFGIKQYYSIKNMQHRRNTTYKTGVPTLFLYSVGVETLKYVVKCGDTLLDVEGDGDGTVNINSLELCKKFLENDPLNTEIKVLKDVDHSKILKHKTTFKILFDFIRKRNSLRNLARGSLRRCFSYSA